jgi:HK97 family phage portal protein
MGSKSGEIVNATTAGALPSVYRACSFISDSLASVELRIVQEQPDGGKVVVENLDVATALYEWSFESRELFLFNAALGGNGLAILRKNARGGVQAIESIVPRLVMAAVDEAQALFYLVRSVIGGQVGDPEVIAQSDMLHLRYRNVGDGIGQTVFGIAPIVTAAEQLGLVLASRSYQALLWKNGAIPAGVLKAPKVLRQQVLDRLTSQWTEFYPKDGNITGKTVILEDGMEFQPIKSSLSASDSNLVEYNRFGIEEVARLYGIPASMLMQTGNASYSTATEEYRAGVIHCLRPWAARLCDCLGRALLTREQRLKGLRIEAPLDHLLVAPGKETSEYLKELVNAGILNTNECRNVLGYPDISGGETYRVPVNMTALENLPKLGLSQPKPQQDTTP